MRISTLTALFFTTIAGLNSLHAQLVVTQNTNATQLAQNLVGPGVVVSNAVMNCPSNAAGTFNGVGANIGLPGGVVLTSGSINSCVGPNNQGGAGASNGAAGDADLNMLNPGFTTHDACILEFDVFS